MIFQNLNSICFTNESMLIPSIFIGISVLHIGCIIGCIGVSWIHTHFDSKVLACIDNNKRDCSMYDDVEDNTSTEDEDESGTIPYERKYLIPIDVQERVDSYYTTYAKNEKGEPIQYKNEIYENILKHIYDEERRAKIESSTVFENTPDGSVLMKYSFDDLGFIYFSNSRHIQLKYLNAVAVKFVSMFQCYELFINTENHFTEECIDSLSDESMDIDEDTTGMDTETDRVEDENVVETNTIEDTTNEHDSVFFVSINNKEKEKNKEHILSNQVLKNKFKYIGCLNDFSWLKTEEYNDSHSNEKTIDYSYFKSLLSPE